MNTPKHTPGPWETYGDDKSDIRPATKAGKNRIIAQCPGYKTERQANARLIAAAPELLEALQSLYGMGEWQRTITEEMGSTVGRAYAKARAAIQKAIQP